MLRSRSKAKINAKVLTLESGGRFLHQYLSLQLGKNNLCPDSAIPGSRLSRTPKSRFSNISAKNEKFHPLYGNPPLNRSHHYEFAAVVRIWCRIGVILV